MALLLIGGAYFVRHNLAQTGEETPVVVDNGSTSEPSTEGSTDVDEGESTNSSSNQGESTPEGVSPDSSTSAPGEPMHTESSNTADHQTESSGSSTTDNLPQTGPGDIVVAGLLLGSIVGVLAAYVRSRALSVSL